MNILKVLLTSLFLFSCAQMPVKDVPAEVISITRPDIFYYKSSLEYISKVARISNCIARLSEFRAELKSIKMFDYTKDNGEMVLNKLKTAKCTIRTYKTKNPFSKAIATTWKSSPGEIYFNMRKNPRDMSSMIATSFHECGGHVSGYGHGDNNPKGKENSVPYKIGSIAKKFTDKCLEN